GTKCDPKDSVGNKKYIDTGLPSTVIDEDAAKTTLFPEGPRRDKDLERLKPPTDMKPQTNHVADLSGTGARYQVDETQSTRLRYQTLTENKGKTSSEMEPDDMEEDTQADEEEHYPDLKKYDNILPLIERQLVKYLRKASIKGYYEENVYHRDQTNKVINAAMNSFDKNKIARGDLLNALNGVTETLKAIQDAVKEDLVLNKKVLEATEAYTKSSTNLTKLLTLIKKFDFQRLKSSVESLQATALI
ncbi:hypothetical protein Tco_0822651, partial [Tanacetum coccineum]